MIKLSLKFDVSLSNLVLVVVGSTACYGLTQCFFNKIKTTHTPQNDNDVLENHSIEVLPQESQKVSSSEKRYAKNEARFKKSDLFRHHHNNASKATADVLEVDTNVINVSSKMLFNNNQILEANTCNYIENRKNETADVSDVGNSDVSHKSVELAPKNGSLDENSVNSINLNGNETFKMKRDSHKKTYFTSDVLGNDKIFSVNLKKHYKFFDALRQFLSLKSSFFWNFLNKTDIQTLELKTSKKTITTSINFLKGYYENNYSKIKPYDESQIYQELTITLDEIIKELLDNIQKDVIKSKFKTAKIVINKKRKYFEHVQNLCEYLQTFFEIVMPLIKNPENIKIQTVEQLQNIIVKWTNKINSVKKDVLNLFHSSKDGKMNKMKKKFVSLFSNTENVVKLLLADLMTKKF